MLGLIGKGNPLVEKTFNLDPSSYDNEKATISFDLLKFGSWDANADDHLLVNIAELDFNGDPLNDTQVIKFHPDWHSQYIDDNGSTNNGFDWELSGAPLSDEGLAINDRHDTRFKVNITLPSHLRHFTVKIGAYTNEGIGNESAAVDNFSLITPEVSVVGGLANPEFISPNFASTIEKGGKGNVVYRPDVNDFSGIQSYALEGTDLDLFSIDSLTGEVRFLQDAKFDHHSPAINNFDFTVRARDPFGNFSDKTVNLSIEDSSVGFWKDGGYRVDAVALKDVGPSHNALILKDTYNRPLSDGLSRHWNGVGVIKSNDGYRMLQIAERGRRRGQYRIAELNGDGVLHSVGGWVDKYKAVSNGYEELFEMDLDNDGRAGIPVAIDVDADGFVDGLGHYRLMANGSSIDLKDQRGRVLSSRSSRLWNAVDAKPKPEDPGSGFEVLLEGVRGRRRNRYQVLSTDANAQVTGRTRWLDGKALAQEGYETTFNQDFNGDDLIGTPTGPSLVDADNNGLVDGITHYALVKGLGIPPKPLT